LSRGRKNMVENLEERRERKNHEVPMINLGGSFTGGDSR
jgi:hypothetical protein